MRTKTTIAALVVLSLTLVAVPLSAADPRWSRIDTPNFIIIGTQGEQSLREVGKQFEGFREALTRLLSSAATSTAVPTVVVVFADDKSFVPFKPIYEGKPVNIGGLFLPRTHMNYILLGPARGVESLRPVFHEYSHLIINNVAPMIPVWLNEGLAEYYSSFEMDSRGQSVIFGRPIPEHFGELGANNWMPLPALLGTMRTSAGYNENSRRGLFYAESWLLVHMMLHGEPDRRKPFGAYLHELTSGASADDAWQHQFGAEDVFKALQQYSRRLSLNARQFKLSDQIERAPGVPVPIALADAETTLGEILVALQRNEVAMQRFDRALAVQPGSIRAALDKTHAEGKVPQVATVPAPSPDWFVDYTIGATLIEHLGAIDRPSLDAARAALERAAAARPDIPNVQVLFAMATEQSQTNAASVVEALKKAHAAAPVRDDYTILLARALARAGDFPAARSLLGQLMARSSFPGARDVAVSVMRQLIAAEDYAKRGGNPYEALPPDRPAGESPPVERIVRPVYREIKEGEQRVEGLLERLDCSAKRIEFSVRLADRVARFQAASFDVLEFITYRTDLQGTVSCGPRQPPEPVYVTYRPGDLDGTVVAIEFLPAR